MLNNNEGVRSPLTNPNIMRIFIEDYNGNDMCCLNIKTLTNISQIKHLTDCSIADVETDGNGEYVRIQLEAI